MWSEWQSSPVDGNTAEMLLKGNCRPGDGQVSIWETLLDLKPQSLPKELPPMSFIYLEV
ncbi:MAG: hypothetical protein Q7J85_13305 [Bacillota bacterium]|nr:hypothetical protein [Bacillota bacterium]